MKRLNRGRRQGHYKGSAIRRRIDVKRHVIVGMKIMLGIGGVFLLSSVYMILYGVFTQCDYFRAKNIEITGTNTLAEEDVLHQADLHAGVNILSVNLTASRKRLVAHPEIEDADIIRTYPDGLLIRVKEHRPLAVVDLGRKFLMNDNGKIYRELKNSETVNLPVVSGLGFSDLAESADGEENPYGAVMGVLRIGQDPDSILPNRAIRRICVDREMGVTLYAGDSGRKIKLGYGAFSDKYQRLKQVTIYLKSRLLVMDYRSIDLLNAERIVVTPMEIGPTDKGKKEV